MTYILAFSDKNMKKIISAIVLIMFLVSSLTMVIAPSSNTNKEPVCGNGICESGEADYCPPCVYQNPPCKSPCSIGTCQKDCLSTCPKVCPVYSAPLCPNGSLISGGKDKCGCDLPPICRPELAQQCKKDDECPQIMRSCIQNSDGTTSYCPPVIKCINGKCIATEPKLIECDATKPCSKGLECYNMPGSGGPKCVKPNPCSYYKCPGNTECSIAESYPPKLMCNCKGDKCSSSTIEQGCIASKNIETGEETISCPTQTGEAVSEEIEGVLGGSSGSVEISITKISPERISIKAKNKEAISESRVSIQDKKLIMQTSNGKNSEIKMMPDTASERAIERLKLKVCSEENRCVIELKEAGIGNQAKVVYEVSVEKQGKFLGLFKVKSKISAEIDAETGELNRIKNPWWAFLASEI